MAAVASEGGGGGGETRVSQSIPDHMRKTIETIREITGKQHSDEEIYAVHMECAMDPNETAQKLLYLDTFHVVKRKRERRKENLTSGKSEGSRFTQGRLGRGGQDYSGGRNMAVRRENGINHITERGGSVPVAQKTKNNAAPFLKKASAVIPNGPTSLSNGSLTHGPSSQSSVGGHVPKGSSAVIAAFPPTGSAVKQGNSTSGTNKHVGSPSLDAEPNNLQGNKQVSPDVSDLELSKNEKAASKTVSSMHKKVAPSKSQVVQKNKVSEPSQSSSPVSDGSSDYATQSTDEAVIPKEVIASEVAATTVEAISQSPAESYVNDKQHVTFPNHFQVSEVMKRGLTFGSFDSIFELSMKSVSGTGGNNSTVSAVESSQESDETAKEPSSNQVVSLDAPEDFLDHPESVSETVLEHVPPSEGNGSSNADSKDDQMKQEILLPQEGPQNTTVQNAPNYNFGLVPTMLGSQHVQFEGSESQAQETSRFPNFVGGNSPALSSRSPTPPIQSSVPPQSVPFLRQPYPLIPYGPYYHPFYIAQMHQYLGHNGFPQQPSTGNVYLTQASVPAAGVKSSLPQLKPGANAGNPNHMGLPFAGSFIAPPVGYSPGSAVTSGSSTGIEDLATSQLKENHIYTTGQLNEGPAVWIPSQEMSNLRLNSLYNLPPHGQHVAFPPAQAGHSAFSGIYSGQPLAASSPMLQHSQAVAGAVETGAPPSGVFQQPQHAQMNWISNF
ncbi:GBF-interacting protein 1-like isoform X2 [Corylus avellana]|uniref:GBF-interacting protein 1-like isoform X2 n=1 Tax=Corylus avellana TaxID=13451 RepID=UPI00286AAA5A|nr:GBF-interacting protein 1-like isoform X2 [Corylus avellana]